MRRLLKRAFLPALVFMTIFSVCVFAEMDIPQATSRFFINDYAGVLDSDTEQYIYEKGKAYHANGGPQIVVLTLPTINGASVEEFSIETARRWGIGDSEKNNGVLVLLVMDSRDIRIEVGYGLEGVLNDGKCGRFIRNASPMLSNGDYSGGIKQIYDDIIGELEEPTPDEENDTGELVGAIVTMILLIIVWIFMYINRKKGGGGYRRYMRMGFYRGGGFGGSGGGFSGGGFSGGGGSFGGGGASGKF